MAESGVVDAIGALQSTVSAVFLWQRQALQGVKIFGGVMGWMKLEQQTLVTRPEISSRCEMDFKYGSYVGKPFKNVWNMKMIGYVCFIQLRNISICL